MTNRPTEPSTQPDAHPGASDQAPPNPETDSQGLPGPGQDRPAEVESGDVAEDPADPLEDTGVDPPVDDSGGPAPDPTRIAETQAAEEPAGE
jgi:hypothetical protein